MKPADSPDPPIAPAMLLVVSGGVASGKSTLARALAGRLGVPRLEADQIRSDLIGDRETGEPPAPSARSRTHEAHWELHFEPGFEDRVYAELMRRAEGALAAGDGLILDACFPSRWWRGVARALAKHHGLPFRLVECRVDPETLRSRLAERDAAGSGAGWSAIARRFEARFEEVEELTASEHLVADCAGPLDTILPRIEARLSTVGRAVRREPLGRTLSRRPEVVTFDCWNTLVFEADWTTAHARRVAAVEAVASERRALGPDEAARAFDSAWARHMDQWRVGIATGARDVAYDALTWLGLAAESDLLDELVRSFQNASHSGCVFPLEGAAETLENLTAAGVRCALVCDTGLTPGFVVRDHLARLGLLDALEIQIFSDEAGVPKPDARVFRAALEPLGASPDRAVHVGDLRRTDVAGARAVGMGTVRIRARHDDQSPLPEADHVVDDHAALRALLS